MPGITYDAGALIAGSKNDRALWALHRQALVRGLEVVVPTAVLAQVWRGGPRQTRLVQLLRGCGVEDLIEANAKSIGLLAGRSEHTDVVDMSVVECALRRSHEAIATSDGDEIAALVATTGRPIRVYDV